MMFDADAGELDVDIQGIPAFRSGQLTTADDLNRLVDALKQLDLA